MQTQLKRYAITIRGRVQHIGYRGIIEGTARKMELEGYVFNDTDNSVKIVCEGSKKSVDNFLSALKEFARTDIESIEKKEIHESFPLPHIFSRIATDEYYEFGRKFDIGLDYLDGIKTDTGAMRGTLTDVGIGVGDMRGTLGDMKDTLKNVNTGIGDVKGTLGDMKDTLKNVNTGIGDVKGTLGDMKGTLSSIDGSLGEFVVEQRGHNQRLEKILEKLSEK